MEQVKFYRDTVYGKNHLYLYTSSKYMFFIQEE